MNATKTPISSALPLTSAPPYQRTMTVPAALMNSTNGKYTPLCTTVRMFTSRYSALARSRASRSAASRRKALSTRTPEIDSCRWELTAAMRSRTRA
jgi:hypothetical protein